MTDDDVLSELRLLCQGPRCQRRPRPLTGRARLCQGCERGVVEELARLPALDGECERLLGGASRRPGVDRVSGRSLPGLPFNTAAAEVRASIRAILSSWCGLIAEECSVTPPPRVVAHLIRFLNRHFGQLLRHEAAAEFAQEISDLARRARTVVDTDRTRQIRIGACVEAGCEGELTVLIRPSDDSPPSEIVCCAEADHRWLAHEWMRLNRSLPPDPSAPARQTARWLGASEVALAWRMSTGSVYRLASEHDWRRRTRAGRVYYDLQDVERTFAGRGIP